VDSFSSNKGKSDDDDECMMLNMDVRQGEVGQMWVLADRKRGSFLRMSFMDNLMQMSPLPLQTPMTLRENFGNIGSA